MGFENPFTRKRQEATDASQNEETVLSRRQFLIGSGALVGTLALNLHEAKADETGLEGIHTQEDRERNVEAIRRYENKIASQREVLRSPDLFDRDVLDIIHDAPPTGIPVFRGTELDHEAFFRQDSTWPSVQIIQQRNNPNPQILFGNTILKDYDILDRPTSFANGMFLDGALISNEHVIGESFKCEVSSEGLDIGGCSISDFIMSDKMRENATRANLKWDRRNVHKDLHGKLVHAPNIHKERDQYTPDNKDITSGVLIQITPNLLYDPETRRSSLFNKRTTELYGALMRRSYMCIVPPRDTNEDGNSDLDDLAGISGSPIFLDEDCQNGNLTPSGIVWGSADIVDDARGVSYTAMLVFGPEVIGDMIDQVNTIVSIDLPEAVTSNSGPITLRIQHELQRKGYTNLVADGVFGNGTREAVLDFQRRTFTEEEMATSIIPGAIDRRTWNALLPGFKDYNKMVLWRGQVQ